MTDTDTARAEFSAAIAAAGLTVESTFVPFSRSRNASGERSGDGKPWRSLNWRCRVLRNGREFIVADYSAGEGHAPGYKCVRPAERAQLIAWEIENGFPGRVGMGGNVYKRGDAKPILPDAADVIASLLLDSSVLDSPGFEAWAGEYGYDTDSRKAETLWRACLDDALKMRAALGSELLERLSDLAREL